MYFCNFVVIGVLSLFWLTTIASNQNFGSFRRIVCTFHDKILLANSSCSTKPINRLKTVIEAAAYLTRPVHHAMIQLKVYKKFNVVYKPFLVDVTENLCDALAKKIGTATYLRIALSIIGPNTSLNHTCPYEGWVRISNLSLDLSSLKVVIPQGEYRWELILTLNESHHKSLTMQVYVEIGEK